MRNLNPKIRFVVMLVLLAVIGYALGFGIGKAVKQEPAPRSTQEPSL